MSRSPRVRCLACEYAWFGPTIADGLRIVGSCTRCGGELEFLAAPDEPAPAVLVPDVEPSAVLGTPTSWAR
jgi:hypothetical protein